MKICIDVRCLMEGRRTGVEEYTLNLLLNLLEIDKKNHYILFYNSYNRPRFNFSIFKGYKNVTIKRFGWPNKLLNFLFWYLGWPKIDRLVGGADVVYFPNIFFGAVSKKCKVVLTIHDLSFERMPEHYSMKRRLWHIFINTKKLCQRADKIIAVSDSTRHDIISWYNISGDKIKTVYSAVCDKFRMIGRNEPKLLEIKEKYSLPFKFILYLGTIEPRKNIAGIIRAYNQLQKEAEIHLKASDASSLRHPMPSYYAEEILKYKLIIAGETGWLSERIFAEIEKSPYKNKIQIIKSVSDKDKSYLYNLATLFVYASFFEGFGFPPLEAMKCGVPVIVSNNSSLPEVIGDGGILVDPDRPDEITLSMKEAIESRELREKLIQRGLLKSKEFEWKKTATAFLDFINK